MTEDRAKYKREFNKANYKRVGVYLKPDEYERWVKYTVDHDVRMCDLIKDSVEKEINSV